MEFLKTKKNLIIWISLGICVLLSIISMFLFYLDNKAVEISSTNIVQNVVENANNTSNENTNNVIIVILDNIEATPDIVTDEKASDKELKEEKINKTEVTKSTSPYYIKVNYKANVITIYKKDENDKYTIPYKAMVCSCGTATPKGGTYSTSSKYRWLSLIHDVYGQYSTRIVNHILFHSVPYSSKTNDSLLYDEYDKLGTKASAGCIRLTVADAKWIYDNCPRGTKVEFYSDSNPGPLGKPSAQKIASVEECRNWDPTDPAAENPWHTYKKEEENTVPPTTDTPPADIPSTDVPTTDTPTTDVPSTDEPTVDTPTTDVPTADTPTTDVPSTDELTTDTPATNIPSTDVPATGTTDTTTQSVNDNL